MMNALKTSPLIWRDGTFLLRSKRVPHKSSGNAKEMRLRFWHLSSAEISQDFALLNIMDRSCKYSPRLRFAQSYLDVAAKCEASNISIECKHPKGNDCPVLTTRECITRMVVSREIKETASFPASIFGQNYERSSPVDTYVLKHIFYCDLRRLRSQLSSLIFCFFRASFCVPCYFLALLPRQYWQPQAFP